MDGDERLRNIMIKYVETDPNNVHTTLYYNIRRSNARFKRLTGFVDLCAYKPILFYFSCVNQFLWLISFCCINTRFIKFTHIQVHAHASVHSQHIHTHTYTHAHIHTCARAHTHTYTHTRTHTHTCAHTRTHTLTHTHTHIHILTHKHFMYVYILC